MSENKNLTDVRIVRDAESGACLIVHDRSKNLDAWCANTEEEAEEVGQPGHPPHI